MLFNSFSFLLFFPIVTLIYFLIPQNKRYLWLLVASYYFYMSWNPKYALLLALSTVITFLGGLSITKSKNIAGKKLAVAISFILNLSILFFFKYFDFFIDNINLIFQNIGLQFLNPSFDVLLPVGISFYTFQALSYTVDLYRNEIPAEKNILKYALFVSFFPQLVAGPIERSKNLLPQISQTHFFEWNRMKEGLLLMGWGFFLKLVVADRTAILVNQVYNDFFEYNGFELSFATLFFGMQIYCDFYSYSLIAKGSAHVMGFKLMDNFKQPYFSTSIAEFWRRWHISLSSWFRDYLYIPLGGNRKGTFRKYLNNMMVFLVSGLWHGANWTFVIWGFLHGIFLVIGSITRPIKDSIFTFLHIKGTWPIRFLQGIITFILVNFAWIFFRASDLGQAKVIIQKIFSNWNMHSYSKEMFYNMGLNENNFLILMFALLLLTCASILTYRGVKLERIITQSNAILQGLIYLVLIFIILIFGIYGPLYSASQFIYFQF